MDVSSAVLSHLLPPIAYVSRNLGNDGHERKQYGRQPAAAKPPTYIRLQMSPPPKHTKYIQVSRIKGTYNSLYTKYVLID